MVDVIFVTCILHLITMLVFISRHGVKGFHYIYSVMCPHYQMVCVRNFINGFENVRDIVQNCPKSKIISSENLCPKIKCPKIKRPKILEINVGVNPLREEREAPHKLRYN